MKRKALRLKLGLTQQEMAMLIGVSRSYLAMYESGTRELPLSKSGRHTKIASLYAGLLKQSKKPKKDSETQKELNAHLQKLQRENEYQRLTTERRIALLQKQQQSESARSAFLELLKSEASKTDAIVPKVELRAPKPQNALKREKELLTLEIRLQTLEFEKTLLAKKL